VIPIRIRTYQSRDFLAVARLLRNGSRRFIENDTDKTGRLFWKQLTEVTKTNLPNIRKRIDALLIRQVATHNHRIVGMLFGNPDEIVMTFVAPRFQGRGIARRLFNKFTETAKTPTRHRIKVLSSLAARPFYLKMGFRPMGGVQRMLGLKVQPMFWKPS